MATYDYTDSVSGAPAPWNMGGRDVVYKKIMKAADIIASDSTMTTATKIAAGDIIKCIDVPAGFVATGSAIYTVTPEGDTSTLDLGLAGGGELQSGADGNATAATATLTLKGDSWGVDNLMGYFFPEADTIDLEYVNDTDTSEHIVYVWGIQLDLTN